MLLPHDSKPENSIYYSAAIILNLLKITDPIDILALYNEVNKLNSMTLRVFAQCLDWLYLIGIAMVDERGMVSKCS